MSLKTHQLKIEYCVQSEIIYIVVKKTTVLYLKLRERLFFYFFSKKYFLLNAFRQFLVTFSL